MFCLHVCMYTVCVSVNVRKKKTLDSMKLLLDMVVSVYVGVGNKTPVFCESQMLLMAEAFLWLTLGNVSSDVDDAIFFSSNFRTSWDQSIFPFHELLPSHIATIPLENLIGLSYFHLQTGSQIFLHKRQASLSFFIKLVMTCLHMPKRSDLRNLTWWIFNILSIRTVHSSLLFLSI